MGSSSSNPNAVKGRIKYFTYDQAVNNRALREGEQVVLTDRLDAVFTVVKNSVFNADEFAVIQLQRASYRLVINRQSYYAEMFGLNTESTAIENAAALHAALDWVKGKKLRLLNEVYKYSGTYSGFANIVGDKRPTVKIDKSALENGSILLGTSNFSGKFVYATNIGLDHGEGNFTTGADAFKASAVPYDSGELCVLFGVVGLGRNSGDAFHSVLVEGYKAASVIECTGVRNQYCGAIKSRNTNVDKFTAIGGQNLLIAKSDSGVAAGSCNNLNITNFYGQGDESTVHGLRILSDNAQLKLVNITNVNITGSDRLLTIESATALSDVNVNNLNGSDIRKLGIVTYGSVYNVNMKTVNVTELGDYVGQLLGGTRIFLSDAYFSLKPTSPHISSALRVETGCSGFIADNVDIVVNRDKGVKGTILLLNAKTQNKLTDVSAIIAGNIPDINFAAQNVDSGVVSPIYDNSSDSCVMKLSASSAKTITLITPTMPGTGSKFPTGYKVHLMSIGQTLTFSHGESAKTYNKGSVDKVRTVNQLISFIFMGDAWHQLDE